MRDTVAVAVLYFQYLLIVACKLTYLSYQIIICILHLAVVSFFIYFWFCVNLDSTPFLWRVTLHSPPFAYNALLFWLLQSGGATFLPPLTSTFLGLLRSRIRDDAYDPHYPCCHCRCKEQLMLAGHCFYQPRPVEAKTCMYKAKLLHDHFYQPRSVEAETQIRSLTRVEVKQTTSTTKHIVTQ